MHIGAAAVEAAKTLVCVSRMRRIRKVEKEEIIPMDEYTKVLSLRTFHSAVVQLPVWKCRVRHGRETKGQHFENLRLPIMGTRFSKQSSGNQIREDKQKGG